MNIQSILAFVIAGVIFGLSVLTATDNPSAFLDLHAALIVFGGTITASAISFQMDRSWVLIKVFFHRVIRGKKIDYAPIIEELMVLAEAYRKGAPNLNNLIEGSSDFFIKESMVTLTDGVLEGDDLFRVLKTRALTVFSRYHEEAIKFRSLGKYPPAFGLMAAVLGMIALLQGLGSEGGEAGVGPAMAVALVGTLYGIAFANMIMLPIAENLVDSAKEIRTKNLIIVEGVRLISEKKNPVVLAEELNAFLLASERIDWKQAGSTGGGSKAA